MAAGWQFTINDYTSGVLVSTEIDEPVGWDGINLELKRQASSNGFFGLENNVASSIQYDSDAADILRNAYYNYGVQAMVTLALSYNCDGEDDTPNIYVGTFDFTTFVDHIADRCYVECATYLTQSFMQFKNRVGAQVDLDSLASFDQLPVAQTVTCNAIFESSPNQIRVTQLLNGLMPGSKITITGSTQDGTFTVASSKPDYSTVNPDLAANNNSQSGVTVSATFDANNNTISINQLVNVAVGTVLNIDTATWPSGNIHWTVYDNSGFYTVTSVQQFFNYTRLTVTLQSLAPVTPANTYNYAGNFQATSFMESTSQDTVVIQTGIIYTSQPTATIITVAETITDEGEVSVTFTGQWLKNNMVPYAGLSKIITVPAKVIEATSIYRQVFDTIYELGMGNPHLIGSLGSKRAWITPEMADVQTDIDETDVGTGVAFLNPTDPYNGGFDSTHGPDTLIFFRQGSLACTGEAVVRYSINYQYIPFDSGDHQHYIVGTPAQTYPARLVFVVGADPLDLTGSTVIGFKEIDNGIFPMSMTNVNGEIDGIVLNPGEYLWMWLVLPVQNNTDAYYPKLVIGAGSEVSVTIASQCVETPCSVYLINEALSRCLESYTNGEMQVYSDYFGRKNAQPVASLADGCGGLECITNGLRIRGCVMPDNSSIPKFFTNLQDMLNALDAIHNIGWAVEPDPYRAGKIRLRVEPYEWFYQNTIMLTCKNIMDYTRETVTSLLPSTFKAGYQQYETWNNNGLYDIFGSRTYRTPLNQLTNELDKTCKWMASDYAIEFTRRQFGVTTSDSRYDDSTFILCLIQKFQGPVEFVPSCFLIETTGTIFTVGNVITISLSPTNNGTYTIVSVTPSEANPNLAYIIVSGAVFNAEFAPAITVVQGSTTYASVPCYFIGANGAIVLDELDLFSSQSGDTIVINGLFPGTYVIDKIFVPVNASQPDNITPIDFPMVIFPTPALSSFGYDPNAIITDETNEFYAVEQGMENGTNILSPETVMNYRISPAHCAMRHYRNVITDRQYASQSLIFTGGEGNFYALGKIDDSCTPENDNISEGGNLSLANFTNADDGKPLFYPEIVKFEYPLTWPQFLAIQANPYGLIQFEHTNEGLLSGYLVDLQYHPYTGMAEFQLYPKI